MRTTTDSAWFVFLSIWLEKSPCSKRVRIAPLPERYAQSATAPGTRRRRAPRRSLSTMHVSRQHTALTQRRAEHSLSIQVSAALSGLCHRARASRKIGAVYYTTRHGMPGIAGTTRISISHTRTRHTHTGGGTSRHLTSVHCGAHATGALEPRRGASQDPASTLVPSSPAQDAPINPKAVP